MAWTVALSRFTPLSLVQSKTFRARQTPLRAFQEPCKLIFKVELLKLSFSRELVYKGIR